MPVTTSTPLPHLKGVNDLSSNLTDGSGDTNDGMTYVLCADFRILDYFHNKLFIIQRDSAFYKIFKFVNFSNCRY